MSGHNTVTEINGFNVGPHYYKQNKNVCACVCALLPKEDPFKYNS